LRSFQDTLPELEKRGIRTVAVSVDPPATTREHLSKMGWTYTFLSDPEAKAVRQYDLAHDVGGGKVIARPAELLIDPTGTVRWVNLTEDLRVRARPETVLQEFDRIRSGSGSP
jgi:peroxiredoxin